MATRLTPTSVSRSVETKSASIRPLVASFGAIALLVTIGAYEAEQLYARRAEQSAGETLIATAQLQSELVARDLHERVNDARLLSLRSRVITGADPRTPAAVRRAERPALELAIAQTRETFGYKQVALFDATARLIAPATERIDADELRFVRRSIEAERMVIVPFRLDADGGLEYAVCYPVYPNGDSTRRAVGAVYLENDAKAGILPLLAQVRSPVSGEESVLGQLVGDSMAIISATRTGRGLRPLQHRIPLSNPEYVGTKLMSRDGDGGVVRGSDYRGVPVIAAGQRVAGSPWMVMTKIEVATLAEAQRTASLLADAIAVAIILLAALVLRIIWLMAERRAKHEHFNMASRYLAATTSSIDGYMLLSRTGHIVDANAALEQMTGYAKDELLARSVGDVMIGMSPASVEAWLAGLVSRGNARFQSEWRRRDGSMLVIDISSTYLGADQEGQLFCFVRDITGQIETTTRLERLNTLYFFLNRAGEALFATTSVQGAYEAVCRSAVKYGQFSLSWVGTVDEAEGVIRPVAWAGSASEYVKGLHITTDPAQPTSQGPTGRCIRESRAFVVNDFARSPLTTPWHALAAEHGLGSSAALPVIVDGQVVAAVMFYARAAGFFSDELLGMLGEITRLLALVVQTAATEERRRREEERRRLSEERFRRLFEASPVPIYVQTKATRKITRVNHAFTDLFGYTLEDLPSEEEQLARFYPDAAYRREVAARFERDLAVVTKAETPVPSPDLRIRCKDGSYRSVQGFASSAADELIIGWVDLTEFRANQAMLQDAERIARLGSWSHDYATDVIRTSPEFLRVLGFDERMRADSADGDSPWLLNLFHPDDRARMTVAFRDRTEVDEVVRAAASDDEPKFLRVRVRVERDASGETARAVGSLQDVTAEELAKQELARLRDHLQEEVDARTAELARANATLLMTDRRLTAMLDMSQKASTLDEAAILQLGIDEAVRLTGSTVGYLHLIDEAQEEIEFGSWATGTGERCALRKEDAHYPVSKAGLWAEAVRRRTPVLHNDFVGHATRSGHPEGHVPLTRHLVVPVLDGDRARLLLGVGNKGEPYDPSDVQELQLIGHDIWSVVQRRRADEALNRAFERVKASDQRFTFAMEASSEGVWEWDIAHGTISFNDSYATMLGYAPAEMARTVEEWRMLLHPEERERVTEEMQRFVAMDEPYSIEFRMRARDGSYRWVLDRGRVLERDAAGTAVRAVGTHTDLTARREAEDELREAKELADAANRAKSSFLAVMSHEIRTPLNGVIAMAEILAQSDLSPSDMDAVQTIQASGANLLAVIDDILDFSKIEAGRLEIDLDNASIHQLVETLGDSLAPVATRRDVDLLVFVAPEVPRLVRCDPTRLRQILYNLAGNAIKFSSHRREGRGRVSVRVEIASVEPLRLAFEVTDNGIGMTPETLGLLFTSFTQAEVSTTRRFGGTGLGLAITKRLVELMDGTIEVASTPAVGSTFTVTLPLDVVDAAPPEPAYDLTGVQGIIIESGDGLPAPDLQRVLGFAGAKTQIAAGATEAAAAARALGGMCVVVQCADRDQVVPDPAFADLPGVHHVQVTRERRAVERIRRPNVVVLDCNIMRPRRVLRAVAVAAGRASPETLTAMEGTTPRLARVAPLSVGEARAQGRLILLAEDEATNQKVIVQQLNLLGHAAEIATDGAEALRLWRSGSYALLLTDLHMPELDGYSLAEAIRREEGQARRMPIVALTANALHGEAVRAEAAGMDGYLTKPVALSTLREILDKFIPRRSTAMLTPALALPVVPSRTATPAESLPAQAMIRISVLEALVGRDPEVIHYLLSDYQEAAQQQARELRQAHERGNFAEVAAIAHKLKSTSRSMGATQFGDLCAELETAGKAKDATAVARLRHAFDTLLDLVDAELTVILAGEGAELSTGEPRR